MLCIKMSNDKEKKCYARKQQGKNGDCNSNQSFPLKWNLTKPNQLFLAILHIKYLLAVIARRYLLRILSDFWQKGQSSFLLFMFNERSFPRIASTQKVSHHTKVFNIDKDLNSYQKYDQLNFLA